MSLPSVTGLDHYIIRTNDLAQSSDTYARLGFGLAPQGRHHKGTRNQTIILDATYLELLYFPDELKATSRFNTFADAYEGAVSVALQTNDSFAVHAELKALGFDPVEPISGGRPVVLPSGSFDASWANTDFPNEVVALPSFFTCGHHTRQLVYRPEWQHHANTARRVERVIVVHPEPASLADAYTRLFGELSVSVRAGQLDVRRGNLRLQVLDVDTFSRRFPGIDIPPGHRHGWFAGSVIGVRDLDRTRTVLVERGVPFEAGAEGALVPPLHATAGALLAFEQESN